VSKETNSDWPDPTDWARRLHDHLEALGELYQAIPWGVADDPENFEGLNLKQARAAEALLATCSALRELPIFTKSTGVAVLHDIAGALADVVLGRSPQLFKSVRPGSPGGDGIHRNYIKVSVVLAVRLLIASQSFAEGEAIREVAKIFAAAGATGRKGKPLSRTTVQDWFDKAHPLSDDLDYVKIDREVEKRLQSYKDDPAWPGTRAEAISWIEATAAHPLLRSKYG